jgi:pimeloyl-ACP methyl ester carboxylesterase
VRSVIIFIKELLKTLDSRHTKVDVLGHSYGGWLIARMCKEAPELFDRVVLVAPGGLGRYKCLQSARSLATR